MSEIKVETDSASSEINQISNAGSNIKFNPSNSSLEDTNLSPFTGFAAAADTLSSAISNYSAIVTQDAAAMQTAVRDFEDNDNNIAGQIGDNSQN
ncbi:TIGR04197 family type VII secretion effector [Staphylococcus epidermidis]|uniref:TIGR04197 family type VII secretion effector n=1 Tax=Staphylococcus epidermidis TaxID=1282 RepID=UPI00026C166C|nr:TIGR04197 family type VII secretion effector [Staphylococcus epidermidis]EJD92744.1 hypothetical protein HMPREF9989_05909 [Staphylococcus epidermidis NIHLM057]EJD94095.1 hypothetical protein HMPREF9988_07639 [Staphylococcus epidermidis NIHLM053]MCG1667156.1 TIGR04197 family type VII secretion effector [Staphylococcus epidermidis]MCG1900006.1 TIGR04197 family type VII secretion effector [Staphylococcus epidermidis]MCG2073449.1 TIGR04197 family type VII secretion effector [Staphylococcus epid